MLEKLIKINGLLEQANDLYEEFSDEQKSKINTLYNEQYNLAYCLRWGLQAAEEVLEDIEEGLLSNAYTNIKVGKNQIYYDKMAGEFVVEKYEYDGFEGGNKVLMYSVVDGFEKLRDAVKCIYG